MNKQFADYTWLAGNHGGKGSLWQGPDHLLVIEAKGVVLAVSETYRRLDYKNIQALTVTRTKRYVWMTALLAVGALLFGILTWATFDQEPFIPISLALPSGLLAILLAVHLSRGPTCASTLQTAVQVLRLKPLGRLKTALPVVQRIEELCLQHQSGLPVTETGQMPAAAAQAMASASLYAPMRGAKPPWAGSGWLLASGLLAVGWGLLLGGELFIDGIFFTLLNVVVGGASTVMAIVALVRAYQHKIRVTLAASLWGGLVLHLATAGVLFVLGIASTAKADTQRSPLEILEQNQRASEDLFSFLAACRFDQAGALGWFLIGLAAALAGCGIIQAAHSPRRNVAAGNPAPVVPPLTPPPPLSQPGSGPDRF